MKNTNTFFNSIVVILLLLLINGCTEYKEPDKIFDPDIQNDSKSPVITAVLPEGEAIAGVRVITIMGENFDSGDTTWIFVGDNSNPRIKSFSSNKIEIYRPLTFGNSLDIKVVIPSADNLARIGGYNIEVPIDSMLTFTSGSGLPDYFAMDIDEKGTFWVCSGRRIDTITADGLFFQTFKGRNDGLTTTFNNFTDMKFGRNGNLYALIGRSDVYQIDSRDSTKRPVIYAALPSAVNKFDFDRNGNMFACGIGGLYSIVPATDSTGTGTATGFYNGIDVVEVRVFNDYAYVADSTTISRNKINSDGTVGTSETVLNLANAPGLETCRITSFNFDKNGRIFLGLTNHPNYALFVKEDDGSITPFYTDNIVPLNIKNLIWGYNSRYLFINRARMITSGMRLFRLGIDQQGAPQPGRDL